MTLNTHMNITPNNTLVRLLQNCYANWGRRRHELKNKDYKWLNERIEMREWMSPIANRRQTGTSIPLDVRRHEYTPGHSDVHRQAECPI